MVAAIVAIVLHAGRRSGEHRWTPASFPMAIFVAVYSMALVTAELLSRVDLPTDRMLAPIYVPVVFLLVIALNRSVERVPAGRARLIVSTLLAVSVCVVPLQRAVHRVAESVEFGAGWYASATWQESDLIRELKKQDFAPAVRLFTNDSAGLYLVAGITADLCAASYALYSDVSPVLQLADLAAVANSESTYLVCFDFVDWPFLVTLDELESQLELEEIVSSDDGSIYRVTTMGE